MEFVFELRLKAKVKELKRGVVDEIVRLCGRSCALWLLVCCSVCPVPELRFERWRVQHAV